MVQLSEHFYKYEFACNDGCGEDFDVPQELIDILEISRGYFKQPIYINSGFRCVKHNIEVKGAPNSFHLKAWAADIVINNVSVDEVYNYFDNQYPDKYGVIKYKDFVHVDIRDYKYHKKLV
ncbi:D-Ala-D-Ala carboxypeptidase family metallohydrolase [Raoultella sp. HC6]|uniref:D-Ala-D-Ala carboxypeptidase family metallohydrolase n=1 Tax=Raoultella sp. HC6 TaxID=2923366 RepID=UPI001F50F526|nr:D-Ala-D-Ala carboxypeptidase family metallohydrolase [Raoultella sp. HC6]